MSDPPRCLNALITSIGDKRMYLTRLVGSRKLITKETVFDVAHRGFAGVAVVLGLLSCASGAMAQNLVADPTLLTLGTSGSPWSLNNGAIGTIESGPYTGFNFFQSGCVSNCFDPVNGSFISQNISLPAGDYSFSLLLDSDIGEDPARTPNAVQVNLFPVETPPADQATVLSVENNTVAGWVLESTEFDLSSAGQYVLQIYGEQIPGVEGVTDIDLQQAPAGAPEPSCLFLAAAGATALLGVKRRKDTSSAAH
jgi:hypothetical protein